MQRRPTGDAIARATPAAHARIPSISTGIFFVLRTRFFSLARETARATRVLRDFLSRYSNRRRPPCVHRVVFTAPPARARPDTNGGVVAVGFPRFPRTFCHVRFPRRPHTSLNVRRASPCVRFSPIILGRFPRSKTRSRLPRGPRCVRGTLNYVCGARPLDSAPSLCKQKRRPKKPASATLPFLFHDDYTALIFASTTCAAIAATFVFAFKIVFTEHVPSTPPSLLLLILT